MLIIAANDPKIPMSLARLETLAGGMPTGTFYELESQTEDFDAIWEMTPSKVGEEGTVVVVEKPFVAVEVLVTKLLEPRGLGRDVAGGK